MNKENSVANQQNVSTPNLDTSTSGQSSQDASVTVRKRGRPRKHPIAVTTNPPRPRGRPRKNPVAPVVQLHGSSVQASSTDF